MLRPYIVVSAVHYIIECLGWRCWDMEIGQKHKLLLGQRLRVHDHLLLDFPGKHSWERLSNWWSFQQRSSQFSTALPIITNPLTSLPHSFTLGAIRRDRGAVRGQRGIRMLFVGGSVKGWLMEWKGRRRKEWEGSEKVGNKAWIMFSTEAGRIFFLD